jgi:glycine betaine catabolism B
MKAIDNFLNKITMYRLVLYYLIGLVIAAVVFGWLGILPYGPLAIAGSAVWLVGVSWVVNKIFARVFKAPTNVESVYITALILALIISPAASIMDVIFLGWAAVLSEASKYILNIRGKHIFNPAAIAVVITALATGQTASWWVGNAAMMPAVVLGGLLVARKIRREDMVFTFLVTAVTVIAVWTWLKGGSGVTAISNLVLSSSLFFFTFVMFTEPLTTPPTKKLQTVYALITGILFAPQIHIGSLYSTPELALAAGNIFAYLVSPKTKLVLSGVQRIQLAPDTYDFVFPLRKKINYRPGQYMEWTLPHRETDSRGNRRYFTLASSPTENNVRLGIRFNNPASSFKKTMLDLDKKSHIAAGQLAGDFTLPTDKEEKLVLVAGGIGVTPYRSMIKYLLDKKEERDIIIMYSNRRPEEVVYREVWNAAQQELNIKTIYTVTDAQLPPPGWTGRTGRINEEMVREEVPDYKERTFYLSGPQAMVTAFEEILTHMGVKKIKTDFFPGFA